MTTEEDKDVDILTDILRRQLDTRIKVNELLKQLEYPLKSVPAARQNGITDGVGRVGGGHGQPWY
jgi:hypothetical protein